LLAVGGAHHSALRLRDDLAGDHQDVAVVEAVDAVADDRCEVVALDDLGDALDRPHLHSAHPPIFSQNEGGTARMPRLSGCSAPIRKNLLRFRQPLALSGYGY